MTRISQSMMLSAKNSTTSMLATHHLLLACKVIEGLPIILPNHAASIATDSAMSNLRCREDSIQEVDLYIALDGNCHIIAEQANGQFLSVIIGTSFFPVKISKYLRNVHPRVLCHAYFVKREFLPNDSSLSENGSPRGQVVLAFYIQPSTHTLYLLDDFMEWLFSEGVPAVDLTESFDANEFLSTFSTHSRRELSRGDYADDEALLSLQTQLENVGLTTPLRKYQLQGVLWMRNKLIRDSDTMDTLDDGVKFAFLNGWVRLTDETSDHTTSSSRKFFSLWKCNKTINSNIKNYLTDMNRIRYYNTTTSSSSSSGGVGITANDFLWYNLLTGEITKNSELSQKWTKSDTLSCVLADGSYQLYYCFFVCDLY